MADEAPGARSPALRRFNMPYTSQTTADVLALVPRAKADEERRRRECDRTEQHEREAFHPRTITAHRLFTITQWESVALIPDRVSPPVRPYLITGTRCRVEALAVDIENCDTTMWEVRITAPTTCGWKRIRDDGSRTRDVVSGDVWACRDCQEAAACSS